MISHEQKLLNPAQGLLTRAANEVAWGLTKLESKLVVLEAVAGLIGGWDVRHYWNLTRQGNQYSAALQEAWAEKIYSLLSCLPIPAPLALAALSREVVPVSEQRSSGAYYTDWRLAELLAGDAVRQVKGTGPWIDPACGSGSLLVAAAMTVPIGSERDSVIRDQLCGADLSAGALRGALLSVASLTNDLDAIAQFQRRLLQQDSLRSAETWRSLAPDGARLVIANPPWEKLKTSRHELAFQNGVIRHYGQTFNDEMDLETPRLKMATYLRNVTNGTRLQGSGEHDLYKLFLELGLELVGEGGILGMLVPAGLIRAQGTQTLRHELDIVSQELQVSVIENRQRHFAIDTRFKFLAVISRVGRGRRGAWKLKVADRTGVVPTKAVQIPRAELRRIRPDLSVPEVRTDAEWSLFTRMAKAGVLIGDLEGPWAPRYRREVDMTTDRKYFRREPSVGALPIIEGRHVSQFRSRAKIYRRGEGRAAIWEPQHMAKASLVPQWYIRRADMSQMALSSATGSRIGFCDITGQTNERTFLAARIPANVVCGNKVPTLNLKDQNPESADLFLALANSLVVDWVMRRLVTTSVNFFLLDGVPLPPISSRSAIGRELAQLARKVSLSEGASHVNMWSVGQQRARIDALVAHSWGLNLSDMILILEDFPLLDRGQPALPEENRSTITADSICGAMASLQGVSVKRISHRVGQARAAGAVPYVPSEFAKRGRT